MGIKKTKLNYRPIAMCESDKIAYEVAGSHVDAVNKGIARKTERTRMEMDICTEDAKAYVVKGET